MDPDFKFLGSYPKFATTRSPATERYRIKSVLAGGATKQFKFIFPERVYDSSQNRATGTDPFATSPYDSAYTNLETYIIFIAINGVVMPTFTAPIGNGTSATDTCNLQVVDRQACPASIVFTGSYSEHPKPCLSTAQTRVYNNFPDMQNTALTVGGSDAGYTLVSGFVNPMHTASGNVTSFQQLNQATAGLESMDAT